MKRIELVAPEIFPQDMVTAGVTLKNEAIGGERGISFSNFSTTIYTDEEIKEYQELLAANLGVPFQHLKFRKQEHTDIIHVIDANSEVTVADGMITNIPAVFPVVKIADCAAVLVFDPVNAAVGAFHSGWKGTMQNIASKGIQEMKKRYGSNAGELLVYISPCASVKNYEVRWDVARHFPHSTVRVSEEKYLFDNRKEIYFQLLEAGVRDGNIEVSPFCTIADNRFHSYRRDGLNSGRMVAFIGLKG